MTETTLNMKAFCTKLMIGVGIAFLPFSWNELQFSFWGATTAATVTQICPLGGRTRALSIVYRFADPSGRERIEEDHVPTNWPKTAIGNRIDIEYCAGLAGQSRLSGNSKLPFVYLFLLLTSATILLIELRPDPEMTEDRRLVVPSFMN